MTSLSLWGAYNHPGSLPVRVVETSANGAREILGGCYDLGDGDVCARSWGCEKKGQESKYTHKARVLGLNRKLGARGPSSCCPKGTVRAQCRAMPFQCLLPSPSPPPPCLGSLEGQGQAPTTAPLHLRKKRPVLPKTSRGAETEHCPVSCVLRSWHPAASVLLGHLP